MHAPPVIPESAPFTLEQRAWLNGMVAALYPSFSQSSLKSESPSLKSTTIPITILFGSQTGTAESLAKQIAKSAHKHNLTPTTFNLDEYEASSLAHESHILLITSTYGDGEPPDSARAFYDALHAETTPHLENLTYSVLGLGDSNYPDFNQCAKDIDARLAALGATRLTPPVFCDIDYESDASTWQSTCFTFINNTIKS